MKVTQEQIKKIMPYATASNIEKYISFINYTMERYDINTTLRAAHFLAQIAHESGSLQYVKEIASGKAYEGRKDLGNTSPGDGVKYKGRGLIQLTGKSNYILFNKSLYSDYDLVNHPEQLEQPLLAVMVAGWFWHTHNLNVFADRDDIIKVTKIINGGSNGLSERIDFLNRAKLYLGYL